MNTSQYNISLKSAKKLLKDFDLIKQDLKKDGHFSQESIISSKDGNDFFDTYFVCARNRDYDILLFDDSMMQFSFNVNCAKPPVMRYAFYQNPIDVISYREYILKKYEIEDFDLIDSLYQEEYEQVVAESNLKNNPIVIRYDSSKREYTESVHPVSHVHVGLENSIRLPIRFNLTPIGFVFFVLKQVYYEQWKYLVNNESFYDRYKDFKKHCTDFGKEYFTAKDSLELYFQ